MTMFARCNSLNALALWLMKLLGIERKQVGTSFRRRTQQLAEKLSPMQFRSTVMPDTQMCSSRPLVVVSGLLLED